MYHFSNHQLYHQNTYQQQCSMFVDNGKHVNETTIGNSSINEFEVVQQPSSSIQAQPNITEDHLDSQTLTTNVEKKSKVVTNKSSVDTSNFSIEERLVAAVWVHERKNTKSSMSQIKQDFQQRFGREPPAKNTLLVWERKLFSTGSVHDAPRPGRPINRRNRMAEVAASVRSWPALSLRARAVALRLPRTTLRTILRQDLADLAHVAHHTTNANQNGLTLAGKHQTKTSTKRPARRKLNPQPQHGCTNESFTRAAPTRQPYT